MRTLDWLIVCVLVAFLAAIVAGTAMAVVASRAREDMQVELDKTGDQLDHVSGQLTELREAARALVSTGKKSHSFSGTVPKRHEEVYFNELLERLDRAAMLPRHRSISPDSSGMSESLAALGVRPLGKLQFDTEETP